MASVITFDPEGTMPGCVHGWGDTIDMMREGRTLTTSQMGLLNHVYADGYSEIRVAMRDGVAVLARGGDGAWRNVDADGNESKVPGNRLAQWRRGALATMPYDRPLRRDSEYMGTPIECEAWLRAQFHVQRAYVRMATSDMVDGELVPTDDTEAKSEAYERTVWRVTLSSTETIAPGRVREDPDTIERCGRIDNERDLYGAALGLSSREV